VRTWISPHLSETTSGWECILLPAAKAGGEDSWCDAPSVSDMIDVRWATGYRRFFDNKLVTAQKDCVPVLCVGGFRVWSGRLYLLIVY
jgi:hypothetical protein